MAREKKAMLVLWQPTHNIGMCVHDDLCVFDCECELLCANCQQTYSIVFSVYCVCDHVGMKRKSVHNEQKTINKKTTKQKELVCLCASECEREKKGSLSTYRRQTQNYTNLFRIFYYSNENNIIEFTNHFDYHPYIRLTAVL